jgi:hypothetical protein
VLQVVRQAQSAQLVAGAAPAEAETHSGVPLGSTGQAVHDGPHAAMVSLATQLPFPKSQKPSEQV